MRNNSFFAPRSVGHSLQLGDLPSRVPYNVALSNFVGEVVSFFNIEIHIFSKEILEPLLLYLVELRFTFCFLLKLGPFNLVIEVSP